MNELGGQCDEGGQSNPTNLISSPDRRVWPIFLVLLGIFLVAGLAWISIGGQPLDRPPDHQNVDGIFYDNIGFHLAGGDGFVVDFRNPKWRDLYETEFIKSGHDELYQWVMQFQGRGPTTMRSPGYPLALSLLYRSCGWRFDVARYFGLLCVSMGLAAIVTWCCLRWGYLVALLATMTILVDYSIMQTPAAIASETLAILAFALTFVALSALLHRPTMWRAVFTGITFAMLFLTRGNWNLGLLLLLAATLLLVMPAIRQRLKPLAGTHIAVVLLTAICLGAPWWIRNCLVTGHFQPFGTAGSSGLVAAYCDESLADYGNWKSAVFHRNQWEVFSQGIDLDAMPLAQREYLVGQASQSKAFAWAWKNWYRLPELAVYRYLSHWGLFNRSVPTFLQTANVVWLIFGLIGCLFLSGDARKVLTFVILLDALIVMLTWAHLGRYGIPVRPLLHIGCAILIVRFWQYVLFERGV